MLSLVWFIWYKTANFTNCVIYSFILTFNVWFNFCIKSKYSVQKYNIRSKSHDESSFLIWGSNIFSNWDNILLLHIKTKIPLKNVLHLYYSQIILITFNTTRKRTAHQHKANKKNYYQGQSTLRPLYYFQPSPTFGGPRPPQFRP